MRRPFLQPTTSESLIERARRLRRKGETRKAIVAMREACLRDDGAAWEWALYGAWLAEAGRTSEAEEAYAHALWLRRKSGDSARARTMQRLLAHLRHAA